MQQKRVVALGFFDGVHLGHGALLKKVKEEAVRRGLPAALLSFDAHPSLLLTGRAVPLINSVSDRAWLARHYYGIDEVILAHFDGEMMRQPWQEFVSEYLFEELNAACVVCGRDYRFGSRGAGNAALLQEACREAGIDCFVVDMVTVDGVQVHSTVIRRLLSEGRMEEANRLLGHPHTLTHRVGRGKHLGSTLGFPTVNLAFPEGVLVPAYGVYATRVYLGDTDETGHPAVTNIGVRPTVDTGGAVTVEGYILDFSGDLYGKTIRMEFYHHLRGERKFESVEALTAEVLRNAEETRAYFQANKNC